MSLLAWQRWRAGPPYQPSAWCAGPLLEARRVLLSPATLVVVPDAEIIEHWQHQKRLHVRQEAGLRVLVYTGDGEWGAFVRRNNSHRLLWSEAAPCRTEAAGCCRLGSSLLLLLRQGR